ncbi:hypothetical protein DBT48_00230 [Aerococcus mictus]|uniref:Uncharacterized protein n=1 Tax=Aerococcus urinae TaxID=1376 RepID=A0A329PXH9_9LACT|nr:hypothetical protein HMPREF2680_04980 [Aerococcus mictus]RAV77527.1 hypothetical protein DBT54_08700 [Aerococcus loyolae]RAV73673.1 hypothetical protein DBT47_01750 [Aerococcus mictus]RAV75619.1 hypothetical protein DBT48_00230 [Aerococcus mictus]RAV78259.1 hypothetical protein DBT52_08945 [Aerococcus mictus]
MELFEIIVIKCADSLVILNLLSYFVFTKLDQSFTDSNDIGFALIVIHIRLILTVLFYAILVFLLIKYVKSIDKLVKKQIKKEKDT